MTWPIYPVNSLSCTECSIQPATLSISTNQAGVFKCSCDNSIQPLPEVIIWLFSNSVVESVPIKQRQQLEVTTSEDDDVTTITSTLTFVIDSASASVLNDTWVDCLALVHGVNGDSTQNLITESAQLYVYGMKNAKLCSCLCSVAGWIY